MHSLAHIATQSHNLKAGLNGYGMLVPALISNLKYPMLRRIVLHCLITRDFLGGNVTPMFSQL